MSWRGRLNHVMAKTREPSPVDSAELKAAKSRKKTYARVVLARSWMSTASPMPEWLVAEVIAAGPHSPERRALDRELIERDRAARGSCCRTI